jgi:hypothetical protein
MREVVVEILDESAGAAAPPASAQPAAPATPEDVPTAPAPPPESTAPAEPSTPP